jgi:hypothetical protein
MSAAVNPEDEVLQVEDDVGDVLGDTLDGVELVEGVVEAHLGDRCAGDRRQQGPPQRVPQGVAEAGLQRADREELTITVSLAECFDLRSLHDQHVCLPRFRSFLNGAVGGEEPRRRSPTSNRARR